MLNIDRVALLLVTSARQDAPWRNGASDGDLTCVVGIAAFY